MYAWHKLMIDLVMRICRQWYFMTATYPKDIVILIEKSQLMKNFFGAESRMFYGIQATKKLINSLNPNDNVCTYSHRFYSLNAHVYFITFSKMS